MTVKRRMSPGKIFVLVLLVVIALSMLLPFVRVISISISSRIPVERNEINILPKKVTGDSYAHVLAEPRIWRSMSVTIFVTLVGTGLSIVVTALMAYAVSRKEFRPRRGVMIFVLLTMVFQAPVIPFFLTVKSFKLLNTVWALILPLTVDAFNLVIMRSFFEETPEALIDSGRIDGCGDTRLLFSIVLPTAKPVLATIALFYAVSYWNIFYNALMFIYDKNLQPLQIIVRSYVETSVETPGVYLDVNYNNTTLQMATIIVVTLPILAVYPFLQKYFTAGVMIGAIKE